MLPITQDNYKSFNLLHQFYFLRFDRQPAQPEDEYFEAWKDRYDKGMEVFIGDMDIESRTVVAAILSNQGLAPVSQKCLLLNPYTQTLKALTMPQMLTNWYAIIGTTQVDRFSLQDGQGTACVHNDYLPQEGTKYGTQFTDWDKPIQGILLFVGPPDQEGKTTNITDTAITLLEAAFDKAKVGELRETLD